MKNRKLTLMQKIVVFVLKRFKPREPLLLSGKGSVKQLGDFISKDGVKKVFIITDEMLASLGLLQSFIDDLKDRGIDHTVFDKITPDPSIELVAKGFKRYRSSGCDAVVGFGGGSSMDAAKIIATLATNKVTIIKMTKPFKIKQQCAPLYMVPTTAGTGSEVTIYAVVSDKETGIKYPIISNKYMAKAAAIDPDLMIGLPPQITAATGMDALTHAVESYISSFRQGFMDDLKYSEKATVMIMKNLLEAYNNPLNTDARNNMGMASYYAGLGFRSISCGYVHAIAHRFGEFYHLPHGLANAIVLPKILDFLYHEIYDDLAELARKCGISDQGDSDKVAARKFIDTIKEMNRQMEIPDKIEMLERKDYDEIAKRAVKEGKKVGSPVPMTHADIISVLTDLAA